ncbi:TAP-like protein [Motilibacter rhizosphaerae]|uniref:TAP-like protein n=1 Tax=Motilibacter rhizosphaerae TaxID=598652 RepID=A0A4V2F4K5_9ACTN|nr:alpha/beta hydrolase [Motilibacter rhizosphaerae]RZS89639.1 TAP-like protein [Motilibacter rhizosphaerae]
MGWTQRARAGVATLGTAAVAGSLLLVPAARAAQPAAAGAASASSTGVSRSAGTNGARPPVLRWRTCAGRFKCAVAKVPLDYDRPGGPRIDVAVLERPAEDPARRLGTLWVNPGGPGGSAVDLVYRAATTFLPAEVLSRFDIVGMDPRGIARSTPLQCYADPEESPVQDLPAFPQGGAQTAAYLSAVRAYARTCQRQAGPLLSHMSTADVARDMDLLRQAMHEDRISYLGYSYGTELGATYAAMFPGHVRSLVLDGVLDPREWAGDGSRTLEQQVRSGDGARTALDAFFRACDATTTRACPVSGAARATYRRVVARLRVHPLQVPGAPGPSASPVPSASAALPVAEPTSTAVPAPTPTPSPTPSASSGPSGSTEDALTYAEFSGIVLEALYSREGIAPLGQLIAQVDLLQSKGGSIDPGDIAGVEVLRRRWAAGALVPSLLDRRAPDVFGAALPKAVYDDDGGNAVICADTHQPGPAAFATSARWAERRNGGVGEAWSWSSAPCAYWPSTGADRYAGPFGAALANRPLVVSSLNDPATRYAGGVQVAHLLHAHLITFSGFGHTSGGSSVCVDRAVTAYLVGGSVAGLPSRCSQDIAPFVTDPLTGAVGGSDD